MSESTAVNPSNATGITAMMTKPRVAGVLIACFATLLLALLDQTIVSAVSWTMVRKLDPIHGIDLLPWLLTVYALADTVVLPLYGKLADIFGAKKVYLTALSIFMVGSALCGLSQNMAELISFRAIQGLGAGGLMSLTMVIMGVLARDDDQKKKSSTATTGLGGVMVGVGMALGPWVGGVLSDNLNWRWVFYINLPLGIAAFIMVLSMLKLRVNPTRQSIDFLGAGLISAATSALLLVAEWGGTQFAWGSWQIIGLIMAGLLLGTLFVLRQHNVPSPLFSLTLLRNATFRIMTPLGFLAGVGLAGSLVYIGGYLQIGRGLTPTQSGLWMLALAAGMVCSALVAQAVVRLLGKYKYLFTLGNFMVAAAMLMFSMLSPTSAFLYVGIGMFVLGLGLGQSLGVGVGFMQNAVGVNELGVATTSLRFAQQLGASFGFTMFGAVLNHSLASKLTSAAGAANANGQLNPEALAELPAGAAKTAALTAYISSVDMVFLIAAVIMTLPVILSWFIKENKNQSGEQSKHSESNINKEFATISNNS